MPGDSDTEKKTSKENAIKAWNKLNPDNDLLTKIITAIETQKESKEWKKDGGQFIPYPATWLNQRRWEDESEVDTGHNEYDF